MTQHESTVYKCGFCKKHYLVKHACEKHEKYCPKNPNNWHACSTCPHLEKDEQVIGDEYSRGYMQTTFRCAIQGKYMHSFVAERIGHPCLSETERMPLECPDHPLTIAKAKEVADALIGDVYPIIDNYIFKQ